MTLQERLRALAAQEERDVDSGFEGCSIEHTKAEREAADALDAKDARIAELEGALRGLIDTAEYWIDREDRRGMSETQYNAWLALGHNSKAMKRAREALK